MDEESRKPLKQVGCDDQICGFRLTGRDDEELVEMLRRHAREKHGIDAPDAEVRAKIRPLES
jgi:predicted small metal-binding protein